MYDLAKTQNPKVLDAKSIDLVGGYRLYVPDKDSPFYDGTTKFPIHLGHVRNPAETYTPTTKNIESAVYGATQTVLSVTTKTEETGTFETVSAKDLAIRGLWAGSAVYKDATDDASAAEPFAANTAYVLGDLVVPTVANGHYYEVTTAGTTSSTEPTGWKTDGSTNTSGGVTFTDRGLIANAQGGLIIIPRNHASFTGMLIDVTTSAIAGRTSEIFVAPNISLRGDGFAAGRDGANETSLRFAYTILGAGAYTIPATVGDFEVERISSGFDILNVPASGVTGVIDKIIAGYYA
ncbi:hypothetical protein [Deinococcus multiflagellatus]|uniref:Tail fiber protein n=1 Tax=Deinococcus multiflagellatus TaxID=1656887 RepID=A0ABW1ZPU7_9DEIO|nr:hypothetical protein [Deinococcus multiflagellatus]MBZ9715276.1 hypothetical protein [Deinococcus multiflagellatus]